MMPLVADSPAILTVRRAVQCSLPTGSTAWMTAAHASSRDDTRHLRHALGHVPPARSPCTPPYSLYWTPWQCSAAQQPLLHLTIVPSAPPFLSCSFGPKQTQEAP